VKAAAAQCHDGRGPITAHLLALEEHQQARYGNIGGMRRPDHMLRALRAGEPVTAYVSLIPRELRMPGWESGMRVTVNPDM
jgi:hypothetical protein